VKKVGGEEMYGKNHQRFVEAFKHMGGQELETNQIEIIILKKFPEMPLGSVHPNDHGEGNKSSCKCARTNDRIFDRIRIGLYRVRS
jgi:hypothetical protein